MTPANPVHPTSLLPPPPHTPTTQGWKAHMLGAMFMGAFWQQFAFVGHDLGHNAVTHNRVSVVSYTVV